MSELIDYSIYYRRWHNDSDEHFESTSSHLSRWLAPSIAHIPRQAKVLDYGCGFGLLTYFLSKHFVEVVGVDASRQQLEVARRRGLPVHHVGVAEFPAWAEQHRDEYDAVFLFDVLEHVAPEDQIKFLTCLVSTLTPAGEIYVKVPNANSLLAARWRYNDWTHRASFTECSLEFVCLHAGLTDIVPLADDSSVQPRLPWLPRWGLRHYYLKSLVRWIWRMYLRSEVGTDERNIQLGLNLLVRATRRTDQAPELNRGSPRSAD